MPRSSHHFASLAVAALLCLVAAAIAQDAAPQSPIAAFGKMIPEGFVNRGVIIPSFDRDGKKVSELHAETLTRIDEERLHATQVKIELISADPTQTTRVHLPSATFHLTDQILRSGERGTVTRADQETSADSLVFDTRTSIGSMSGRVRTLIFDTGTVSHESKPDKPAPKAAN